MQEKFRTKIKDYFMFSSNGVPTKFEHQKYVVDRISVFFIPGLILAVINNLLTESYTSVPIILLSLIALLVNFSLNRFYSFKYSFLTIYFLTILMTTNLMILNDGLRDAAIIIFPVIITVTGFVLNPRLFVVTTIVNLSIVITIGLLEYYGKLDTRLSHLVDITYIMDVIIILVTITFIVYLMQLNIKSKERELKESNEMKDRFFKILAHDLKNPFQVLKGSTNYLSDNFNDISEDDKRDLICNIRNAIENQYELLNKLLSWGKLRSGVYSKEFSKCDLKRIIDQAIKDNMIAAELKRITFRQSIKTDTIKCDNFLISTAIRNLLSNAVKYSCINSEIEISAKQTDTLLSVMVRDNGIGMTENQIREIIGKKFVQSLEGTNGETGSGLGLQMVREIVRIHGGELFIESELSKGSIFKLLIPAH